MTLTHWLWFDYETTGLWKAANHPPKIIQMAGILLPFDSLDLSDKLFEFDHVFNLYQHEAREMDRYVYGMHADSGLLDRAFTSIRSPGETERWLLKKLRFHGIKPQSLAFAGTGIAPFDIPLMRHYMFDLYQYGYYATYDLGAGRRMMERILHFRFAEKDMPDSSGGHTALEDVYAMLDQARWLRENYGFNKMG